MWNRGYFREPWLIDLSVGRQVNPERRPIGPVIACTILSAVTVIVLVTRLISKFFVVRRPGWDDYLIILSTVCIGFFNLFWGNCKAIEAKSMTKNC